MDDIAVRLRPFEEADLWYFDRLASDPTFSAPFEWSGFTSPTSWRSRWHNDRLLGSNPFCLVVADATDDALVGMVDWRQNDRPAAGVWEIGVMIVPEQRKRGAGTVAQRLLIDYLFATTTCHRVWAGTEVDNLPEQRALERVGLRREGCVRGHHFRDGQWRDGYLYGITRDEWHPPNKPAT